MRLAGLFGRNKTETSGTKRRETNAIERERILEGGLGNLLPDEILGTIKDSEKENERGQGTWLERAVVKAERGWRGRGTQRVVGVEGGGL